MRAARLTRLLAPFAVAGAVVVTLRGPAPATATTTGVDQITAMLNSLTVEPERNTDYSRDAFADWRAQADGCDTREIVLITEARGGARHGCVMTGAMWWSYLDGVRTGDSSAFDIDHTVALGEAWGSGARDWTRARRDAYSNDLGYRDSLIAVSASSNRSKGDRDPAEWTPPRTRGDCRLLEAWIAVKWRWRLSVDTVEKSALANALGACTRLVVPIPERVSEANRYL